MWFQTSRLKPAQGFRKAAANASRTFVELLWHWTASAAQAGNRK
jgi:hypothetical protein